MPHSDLVSSARNIAMSRARPHESGFPVGAALRLDNAEIVRGANYEDLGRTPVGACAERSAIFAANSQCGPLGAKSGEAGPRWEELGIWAPTQLPITPCGICRDVLANSAADGAQVHSGCNTEAVFRASIEELFPVFGRGARQDCRGEIELLSSRGGQVLEKLNVDESKLFDEARNAASKSYLPPFTQQPKSGAALETLAGTFIGWFTTDATTRLGGSAIANAARAMLIGNPALVPGVIRVALFSDVDVLRAPNGYDLQLLMEVAASSEIPVIFGSREGNPVKISLDTLLPHGFGKRDLGY